MSTTASAWAFSRSGETVTRHPTLDDPLSALSFKTMADKNGDLNFVRVYSGVLEQGAQVWTPVRGKKERASRLMILHASARVADVGRDATPVTV